MRLLQRAEKSFVGRITQETRLLVDSHRPLHTKIAILELAAADEASHIHRLILEMQNADADRRSRLELAIELRQRALQHYRATAKSLPERERKAEMLRQIPRMFTSAVVSTDSEAGQAASAEFPFMEFSS